MYAVGKNRGEFYIFPATFASHIFELKPQYFFGG